MNEFDIVTEEITLEPSERTYITNKRHVLVTDIVKKHPTLDISTGVKNAKLELVPNIPVKTLNWFFRQKSFENEDVITGGDTLLANVFANQYNFSSNVEYSINNEFYNPPMAKAKIFVNGEDIPNIQDGDLKYFQIRCSFSSRFIETVAKHLHVCILDKRLENGTTYLKHDRYLPLLVYLTIYKYF